MTNNALNMMTSKNTVSSSSSSSTTAATMRPASQLPPHVDGYACPSLSANDSTSVTFGAHSSPKMRRIIRQKNALQRQQRVMSSCVKLMNQGVQLFEQGRDSKASQVLREALAAMERMTNGRPPLSRSRARQCRRRAAASSASTTAAAAVASSASSPSGSSQAVPYDPFLQQQQPRQRRAVTSDPITSILLSGSSSSNNTNGNDAGNISAQSGMPSHGSSQNVPQSQLKAVMDALLANPTFDTAALWIDRNSDRRSPTSVSPLTRDAQNGPAPGAAAVTVTASVHGLDDMMVFGDMHTVVPIAKSVSAAPDSSSITDSPCFAMYNKALFLSEEEINSAKQYHYEIRMCQYECGDYYESDNEHDDDDDDLNQAAVEAQAGVDVAIEKEFQEYMLPVVSACIVYNMALLFDMQSRCTATASNNQHAAPQSPHAANTRKLFFATKAYMLYGTATRLIKRKQWESFSTAMILRVATANNQTALVAERRMGNVADSRTKQQVERACNALLHMIHFVDFRFHCRIDEIMDDGVNVQGADWEIFGSTEEAELNGVRWNAYMWSTMNSSAAAHNGTIVATAA